MNTPTCDTGMQHLIEHGLELMDTQPGVAFEALRWIPESTKPDADTTVLLWDGETPFFCGWWDDALKCWFDASTGGVVEGVTHWAEPAGPR